MYRKINILVIFCFICLFNEATIAQKLWDIENSTTKVEKSLNNLNTNPLPIDWQNWRAEQDQFRLYTDVIDNESRIDIKNQRLKSYPFRISFNRDTLYIDIAPPDYDYYEQSSIENINLKDSLVRLPMVIRAGTEQGVYWYSYKNNEIKIDTLLPAPFISLINPKSLDSNIVYLYLPGKDGHAKKIKNAIKKLKEIAKLVQLEKGFYQGIWNYVSKERIQGKKVNWIGKKTKDTGALIVFQVTNPSSLQEANNIIAKIVNTKN